MQVGHGLTHGKGGLVQVQRAFEHHRQDVGAAAGAGRAGVHHFSQPVAVVLMQLVNACVQAPKRLAVGGQHQRVGIECPEPVDRLQKQRQGVGLGLHVIDADVGRDARQHHVARDQYLERLAGQRDVFRRVAVAADAGPVAPADADHLPIHHAVKAAGDGRHQSGVVVAAATNLRKIVGIGEAVRGKKTG